MSDGPFEDAARIVFGALAMIVGFGAIALGLAIVVVVAWK
jgi:hypothetical protein